MISTKLLEIVVRGLAARSPDNVYTKPSACNVCSNVAGTCTDGTVGCIIGQAITLIDPAFDWRHRESLSVDALSFDNADPSTVLWLQRVQSCQDSGSPWCKCIDRADTKISYWSTL